MDVDALTNALMYGKEEDVRSGIENLVSLVGRHRANDIAQKATQTKDMDPDQIRNYVSEAIAFENAKGYLDKPPESGGFADIWGDPVLKDRFIRREAEIASELVQKGQKPSYLDIYNETAKEIRSWRDQFLQKHIPKTGLENRADLKRQTGIVRSVGGKPQAPQESQPLTHEDKLERMRKARGQL